MNQSHELLGIADAAGRVRVKICGITNREDAEMAIELGADALGFNTFPGSKRYMDVEREAGWIAELPSAITKVAVVVNSTIAEIESLAAMRLLDLIQLHGSEDAEFCALLAERGIPFIKAVALRDEASLEDMARFRAAAILLDTYAPAAFGGTGELLDIEMAQRFVTRHPQVRLIASGGLRPENVAAVISALLPYAVDVASGVESEPRRKDRELVAGFIAAVRAAQ